MTLDELHPRLSAHLARHNSEHSRRPLGPLVKLTGGWASSLYTFTLLHLGSGDAPTTTLVLKMYAPDQGGREHATREWRALTHLRAMDYHVPGLIAFEPDADHLGRPFLVLDHIEGASLWSAFEEADPVAQARLTQSFAERLVALHALDPRRLDPVAVRTHPYGYIDNELARLRRDGENSAHTTLFEVFRWLEDRRGSVPCERPVILHRDYHPWNVLVDAAGRLWVIDWDWQIGDARFDVAWTCTLMQRSGHHAFSDTVQAEYVRQSGRPLDELAYFEVLTTIRWLLNVLPAVKSETLLDAAARADFRSFLVQPVRQAQTLLQERTGITVTLQM